MAAAATATGEKEELLLFSQTFFVHSDRNMKSANHFGYIDLQLYSVKPPF